MEEPSSMYGNTSHDHQDILNFRVRVILMGKWDDYGTGHITVYYKEASEERGLLVVDEDDCEQILIHCICTEDIYRKQQDTIIYWRNHEYSSAIALSFQEYSGCSYIWDQICSTQRSLQFNSLTNPELTSGDAIKHKEHIAQSGNKTDPVQHFPGSELTLGDALVADIGTKKSLSCKEVIGIEEQLVLDHSHQPLIVEDALHSKGLNVGAEQCKSTINVIGKTCLKETSVEGKKPETEISFQILSEHFGKSLDDAANSFHEVMVLKGGNVARVR